MPTVSPLGEGAGAGPRLTEIVLGSVGVSRSRAATVVLLARDPFPQAVVHAGGFGDGCTVQVDPFQCSISAAPVGRVPTAVQLTDEAQDTPSIDPRTRGGDCVRHSVPSQKPSRGSRPTVGTGCQPTATHALLLAQLTAESHARFPGLGVYSRVQWPGTQPRPKVDCEKSPDPSQPTAWHSNCGEAVHPMPTRPSLDSGAVGFGGCMLVHVLPFQRMAADWPPNWPSATHSLGLTQLTDSNSGLGYGGGA